MTTDEYLSRAARKLEQAGIGTARLDALVLLEDVTRISRAQLLAEPSMEIKPQQTAKLEKLLKRRARHEPLAYIRGMTEFYGREFVLTPAVLEPRPESETMIELLKTLPYFGHQQPKSHPSEQRPGTDQPSRHTDSAPSPSQCHKTSPPTRKVTIADVGAGSGALGITAQLELPDTRVDLLEIDKKALLVAKENVDKFTLNINTIESDLLSASRRHYDILLCNLPYVPDSHTINQAASHEPRIAIFGGPDGLDLYRMLFEQISNLSGKPLYILTEALPPQHTLLKKIAQGHGYNLMQSDDFIQVFTSP